MIRDAVPGVSRSSTTREADRDLWLEQSVPRYHVQENVESAAERLKTTDRPLSVALRTGLGLSQKQQGEIATNRAVELCISTIVRFAIWPSAVEGTNADNHEHRY